MSHVFDLDEIKEDICLHEFVDSCSSNFVNNKMKDLNIEKIAIDLKKFSNTKDLFVNFLNIELKNLDDFQKINPYGIQSFLMYTNSDFFIRANIWPPLSKDFDKVNFSYGIPHDHNFDLITIGHLGPGYITELWEYDKSKIRGEKEEFVDLKKHKKVTLSEGKVLYMEKSKDIHIQHPPQDISISINFMTRLDATQSNQYYFDIQNNTISGIVNSSFSYYDFLFNACSVMGDMNTLDILNNIKNDILDQKIKNKCLETISSIQENFF